MPVLRIRLCFRSEENSVAIQRVVKDFAPKTKEVRYLNRTFADFRQNLIEFAKVYFPASYNDFNETSPGMMFIEMASFVGDVLTYYIDDRFKENLLMYAEEQQNIISMAQAFGYKAKPATAAATSVDIFQLAPALGSGSSFQPDERYYLKLDDNAVVASDQFGNVNFRTQDQTDFADPIDRQI